MAPEDYYYRVVSVHDDGEQTATVQFDSLDYATKLWMGTNDMPHIVRCWIERRPKGKWEVCSSENGSELMALAPPRTERPEEDR